MQMQFARTTLFMAGLLTAPVMAAEFEEDKKRKYQTEKSEKVIRATAEQVDHKPAQSGKKISNSTSTDWDNEVPPADWLNWLKGLGQTSY